MRSKPAAPVNLYNQDFFAPRTPCKNIFRANGSTNERAFREAEQVENAEFLIVFNLDFEVRLSNDEQAAEKPAALIETGSWEHYNPIGSSCLNRFVQ